MTVELYAPLGYTPKADCNGCGSGWNAKLVPDTIYGMSIKDCCCIHDYGYEIGKTIEDKQREDRAFLNNTLRKIDANTWWWYPKRLARIRAYEYYKVVDRFGGTAFWEGKNEKHNLVTFNA